MSSRPALLLPLALALTGCAHRVLLKTDPAGARVSVNGEPMGFAPTTVQVLWVPFKPLEMQVELPGYRTVTLDLQKDLGPIRLLTEVARPWRWDRWWGGEARRQHEILLIRYHGRAGTWTPEDARR